MSFKFSDIPLELSAMSFRYYNDLIWYTISIMTMLPDLFIGLYKLYRIYKNPKTIENSNPKKWDNILALSFAAYSIPYYIIDLMVSVYEGTCYYPCRFALVYHHLISLVILPIVFSKGYFEWWEMFMRASHSLLMFKPSIFLLNFVYLFFVLIFCIKLYVEPYKLQWKNRFVLKFFPFIFYSFILMLQCEEGINGLPYLF